MNPIIATPHLPMIPQPMFGPFAGTKNETTLYVGNLHPSISNELLFHEFSPFGLITSSRVMKNVYTKESRCFAFVTYSDSSAAQRAQREMNNKMVFKRELRVHFKKNQKNWNLDANYIIKNIAKSVTSKQLSEECAKYGEVSSCFIKRDDNTDRMESLGYGYVQFEKTEDGNRFRQEFEGKELNGQKVTVEKFVSRKLREKDECPNLYIKDFPAKWSKEQIESFIDTEFGKFGEISSKMVQSEEKHNKFYAFAAFKDPKEGFKALNAMNGQTIDGTTLYVSRAVSKSRFKAEMKMNSSNQQNPTNIYVRSIKGTVTEEQLRAAFEKFGKITSLCLRDFVPAKKTGDPTVPAPTASSVPLKFGFINYQRTEDAQNALIEAKKSPEIRSLSTVEGDTEFVFIAQPKHIRAQYLTMMRRVKETDRMRMAQSQYNMKQGKRKFNPQMPGQMMPGVPALIPGFPMGAPMMPFPQGPMIPPTMVPQMNPQIIAQQVNLRQNAEVIQAGPPDYKKIAEELRVKQDEFLRLPVEERKNRLGNIMYDRVKNFESNEQLIPKITGMLIDTEVLDFGEILEIIENDQSLKERINEAIEVINESNEPNQERQE